MQKLPRKMARLAVFTVPIIIVLSIVVFSISESNKHSNFIEIPLMQGIDNGTTIGLRTADISLKVDSFNPIRKEIGGTISVSLRPRYFSNPDKDLSDELRNESKVIMSITEIMVWFSHYSYGKDGIGSSERQGESVEPLQLKPTPLSSNVSGENKFVWRANSLVKSFWYPFDKYLLYVNPSILRPDISHEIGYFEYIDMMSFELQVPSMRVELKQKLPPSSERARLEDAYQLILDRPLPLRLLTLVFAALSILWLGYLLFTANSEKHMEGILTFFIGIWGVKSSLMGSLYIFPCFIDYCTITLAITAVLIVLFKWLYSSLFPNTKSCPYCLSRISIEANKCPKCTSSI